MKYIGPFLRINALAKDNIGHELFHLSKEAIKHIVLESKAGITIPMKELKLKNIPNIDSSTFASFSPLLCIYKKGDPKLTSTENAAQWNEEKLKKEIIIRSNAFMTLSILELCDYYKKFKDICAEKYALSHLYLNLAKKQLEFYASYFRNEEGVFVDKKDLSTNLSLDLVFEEKNKKFKFSDQALLMAAFYKCSQLHSNSSAQEYETFSLDIFNMFLHFKEELYELSYEELNRVCFSLTLFYQYSKKEEVQLLLMDLYEYLMEGYKEDRCVQSENKIEHLSLLFINTLFLYETTSILKFHEFAIELSEKLVEKYDSELGIFKKNLDKKEILFSSEEIVLYLLSMLLQSKLENYNDKTDMICIDVFKKQVINSGIILSWPDAPTLDDVERYKNYSLKSQDILEEQHFKLPTLPTPEASEFAPIFIKSVTFHLKKESFKQDNLSFDSTKNMFIFFLLLHFLD